MPDEKLKPCPFCGNEPREGCADPGAPYPGGYYFVECTNDDCFVRPGSVKKARVNDADATIEFVRLKWNTRADDGDKNRSALEQVSRLLEERGITATAAEIIKIIVQRDALQVEVDNLRGELAESYHL